MLVLVAEDRVDSIAGLRTARPATPVIVLTLAHDARGMWVAFQRGARGYVAATAPPARIWDAVCDVLAGGIVVAPEFARHIVSAWAPPRGPNEAVAPGGPTPPASACPLTPHEERLLRLLGEGDSYRSAATRLGCSVNTVAFHVRNIYRKLGVHSKAQAVAVGLRAGWV